MKMREVPKYEVHRGRKGQGPVKVRHGVKMPEQFAPGPQTPECEDRVARANEYADRLDVVVARAQELADAGDWTGAKVLIAEAERLEYWWKVWRGK